MSAISSNVRWSIIVSSETDNALRQFLASQGKGRKGEISRFVEEAVRSHISDLIDMQVKKENTPILK